MAAAACIARVRFWDFWEITKRPDLAWSEPDAGH